MKKESKNKQCMVVYCRDCPYPKGMERCIEDLKEAEG